MSWFTRSTISLALDEVVTILDASRQRDGWWGPARIAYDEVIAALCERARVLASFSEATPSR